MKKLKLFMFMLLFSAGAMAQLSTGSIAFVGFNTDGDDDIAFVALDQIPANSTIYFCDSEWDGSQFGTDENDFTWTSGSVNIPAGTVITIHNLSATITSSYGSVSGGTGLSSSGEAVFAYTGTGLRMPTTFLAAISNVSSGFGTLSGTGLENGLTAITLTETADIAIYNGPRTGIDKNGYYGKLKDMSNWLIQDTDNDDHNDNSGPDLPFDTTAFTFSLTDVSAPYVTSYNVVSKTVIEMFFSEQVDNTITTTLSNYSLVPTTTISNVAYDNASRKVTITHAGLNSGVSTYFTVENIEDPTGNVMTSKFTSDDIFYNPEKPNLIITEIIYNVPVSFDDDVEFLEIYNAGNDSVALGGFQVKDEGNFTFTFPQMKLASKETVLLTTNKEVADTFYNATFIDMVANSGNTLGNGGELLEILNSLGETIFSVEYDDGSPWPTEPDGDGYSLELLNTEKDPNDGSSWRASTNFYRSAEGTDIYCSPGSFTEVNDPILSFEEEYLIVKENGGSISFNLTLSDPALKVVEVDLNLLTDVSTAQAVTDFTLSNSNYTFSAGTNNTISINVPIVDNSNSNIDKLFVLTLQNPVNAKLGAISELVVYILDDERTAPVASEELDISFATSFRVDENGTAEIVDFDSATQRLFVLNSTGVAVEVLDFSNPRDIKNIKSIDMSSYGNGATSIACRNGIVAATVDAGASDNGSVIILDTDGNFLASVEAGNLPDMVTFTHDGKYILVANEGQPSGDYSIDAEGSISVIDIQGGADNVTQANVSTIDFNAYDSQLASLKASGVRIFGYNASVSQDVEPEYITVSKDSKMAWVSLQENNAIAVIDLVNMEISDILPLGTKDHSLAKNALDASDRNDSVFISTWNIHGMYMPDAIASYSVNGQDYVVTANEGDQREYDHIDEDVSVGDADYVLDPTVFPNAELLKKDHMLGRIAVSPYSGDIDNDGDFDEIHVFGARSFSIFNATTGALVYDSEDDFEVITSLDPKYRSLFNASNSNNNFKNRSDNKGPEPEGITVAAIEDEIYAFITLERTGGMMVYNVTDPQNAKFVKYLNSRDLGDDEVGDLGPEGIIYINPEASPADTALVVMANEVSGTISVFYINNVVKKDFKSVHDITISDLKVYPNPSNSGKLYFSRPISFSLYNIQGQVVKSADKASSINVNDLVSGVYSLVTVQGESISIIVNN